MMSYVDNPAHAATDSTGDALKASSELSPAILQMLAHDMRETLSDVRLLLAESLMTLRTTAPPEAVALVEQAEHDVSQLFDAVVSMLHLARASPSELTVDAIDLRFVLPNAVLHQAHRAEAKGITMLIADEASVPWVVAEPTIVSVVLDNLLSNAVKYSPLGGTIRIGHEVVDDRVWLHVQDEGDGIPEAERDALFHTAGRLSPRPTAGESSFGLGLFLAAELTRQIGGTLSYAPAHPKGSVFSLMLPLSKHHGVEC